MKTTRFLIQCLDGKWRYIFCRSGNSIDCETGCSVFATESRARAFVDHMPDAAKSLAYFTEHANGRKVRAEDSIEWAANANANLAP